MEPQTEPDRRAGLHGRNRRARGTGQDGGQGRAVRGVVPGLACGGVTGRTGSGTCQSGHQPPASRHLSG